MLFRSKATDSPVAGGSSDDGAAADAAKPPVAVPTSRADAGEARSKAKSKKKKRKAKKSKSAAGADGTGQAGNAGVVTAPGRRPLRLLSKVPRVVSVLFARRFEGSLAHSPFDCVSLCVRILCRRSICLTRYN